jgi:type IV secretion system protein VirB8
VSDKEAYFREARSWAEDARVGAARSRRTAWTIAGIAVGVAAFEAVALAMLAPLKTVQPITLLVDRQTGFVQSLDPTTPQRVSADAALTDAYLAQYVTAREGFDRATIQGDYRRVGLWSAGRARASYISSMAASSPAAPSQYPAGTVISVRVKSVSRLAQGSALVRFDTQRSDRSGGSNVAQPWISVVRFRYSSAPMQMQDRLVNPLGFQVTGYRRDAEAVYLEDQSTAVAPRQGVSATALAPARPIVSVALSETPEVRERPTRIYRNPRADRTTREVPLNQIPIGSPLSPGSFDGKSFQ